MSVLDLMRVYDCDTIRRTITISDAIEPVSQALSAFSAGSSLSPPLTFLDLENGGDVHIKSGYARGASHFVTKIASMAPANRERGIASSNGLMLVCSAETGYPVALLNDKRYLTDIRTAAVGAIAAQLLAPTDFEAVGVLGQGCRPSSRLKPWLGAQIPPGQSVGAQSDTRRFCRPAHSRSLAAHASTGVSYC